MKKRLEFPWWRGTSKCYMQEETLVIYQYNLRKNERDSDRKQSPIDRHVKDMIASRTIDQSKLVIYAL